MFFVVPCGGVGFIWGVLILCIFFFSLILRRLCFAPSSTLKAFNPIFQFCVSSTIEFRMENSLFCNFSPRILIHENDLLSSKFLPLLIYE